LRVSRMAEGRWESGGCAAGVAINDLLGLLTCCPPMVLM
jgi:hypothetical protein